MELCLVVLPSKTYLVLKQIYEANAPIKLSDLNGYEPKQNFKDTDLGERIHHLERLDLITSAHIPIEVASFRADSSEMRNGKIVHIKGESKPISEMPGRLPNAEPFFYSVSGVTMTEDQRRRFESGEIQTRQPRTKHATDDERLEARRKQKREWWKEHRAK